MSEPEEVFSGVHPDYAADTPLLDHQPWDEHGAVDTLITLQGESFEAEIAEDRARIGSLALRRAAIERELGNLSEAAAYTDEAATAFESGGLLAEAIAANCVLANEYRNLNGPDLAVGAIQHAFLLRTGASAAEADAGTEEARVIDIQLMPVITRLTELLEVYTSGLLPKSAATPTPATIESLFSQFDELIDLPIHASTRQMASTMHALGRSYFLIGDRRFGLPRAERKLAKERSKTLCVTAWSRLMKHGGYWQPCNDQGEVLTLRDFLEGNIDTAQLRYERSHGRRKSLSF